MTLFTVGLSALFVSFAFSFWQHLKEEKERKRFLQYYAGCGGLPYDYKETAEQKQINSGARQRARAMMI